MDNEKKKEEIGAAGRFFRGVLGSIVGTLPGIAAGMASEEIYDTLSGKPFSTADLGRDLLAHPRMGPIASDVTSELRRQNVKVKPTIGRSSQHIVDAITGNTHSIEIDRPHFPTVAHEIGHASKPANLATKIPKRISMFMRTRQGTTGADLIRSGLVLGGAMADRDSFLSENSPLMTGLTFLPILAEELRATGNAVIGAHALHGRKGALRTVAHLAPAFGVYAGNALASVGAAYAARELAHPAKTAGAFPTEPKVGGNLKLTTSQISAPPVGQLKPKTTPPKAEGQTGGNFAGIPAAKPPSLTKYYRDTIKSFENPGRGVRT